MFFIFYMLFVCLTVQCIFRECNVFYIFTKVQINLVLSYISPRNVIEVKSTFLNFIGLKVFFRTLHISGKISQRKS